jgi:hypothetical protein
VEQIAIYYLSLLDDIRKAARELGYAIAIHGSLSRDFDLIAAPWTFQARPALELVEAVRAAVNGHILPDGTPGGRWDAQQGKYVSATVKNPEHKPHGRLAWCIQLGAGAYLDLSIMPRGEEALQADCVHEWTGKRVMGDPAEPDEYVEYCKLCGMENPGSWVPPE